MTGYIKLHRSLNDSVIMQDHRMLSIFVFLLMNAMWKPTKVNAGNALIALDAGQYMTGRKKLAEATGLNENAVRVALQKLEANQTITIKPSTKYSIISITNWKKYQQDTNNTPTTHQQRTNNAPLNEEDKEVKERYILFSKRAEKSLKTKITDQDYENWLSMMEMAGHDDHALLDAYNRLLTNGKMPSQIDCRMIEREVAGRHDHHNQKTETSVDKFEMTGDIYDWTVDQLKQRKKATTDPAAVWERFKALHTERKTLSDNWPQIWKGYFLTGLDNSWINTVETKERKPGDFRQ